jgi:xylulokinase
MPKDYVNYRLTGEIATDWTEASVSFLMEPAGRAWSPVMLDRLGLDGSKLPPIRSPQEIVGHVTDSAALATGLASGTPVLVGGGDFRSRCLAQASAARGSAPT